MFSKSGFPQVFPVDHSGSKVEGFINVLDQEFYIHLSVSHDCHPKSIKLRGSWKLLQLLQPVINILEQHLAVCSTTVDMLQEIKNTTEQQLQACEMNAITSFPVVQYYEILFKHLQAVGWNKVHSINSTLDTIQLKAIDSCHRHHILNIHLPTKFPDSAPTCTYDMPGQFNFSWSPNKTLLDLYNHFLSCLEMYSELWTWMEEIDEYTWVLEPEKPNRSTCKRRIALTATASLLVIVNPLNASIVPVCHFMGPESVVGPLRKKFNENIDQWDESFSLLTNLKNVLDMDFPSPLTSTKEEFFIECGICYSYKLEDALPDLICNNPQCKQAYHQVCLYKWLKSFPSTKQSFDTIFGDCLYCNLPIWCKMPGA